MAAVYHSLRIVDARDAGVPVHMHACIICGALGPCGYDSKPEPKPEPKPTDTEEG